MSIGDLVAFKCRRQTLEALAGGLTRYGPAGETPEWLVSGVWLAAGKAQYLATASVEVLSDGFVARPLAIMPPAELAGQIEAELPDVSDRLRARGNGMDLPPPEVPQTPVSLTPGPGEASRMHVLVRLSRRASITHHVACALLFAGADGRSVLVGTDPSTLAMVLSEDPALIDRYRSDCETLTPADYLERCGD